jgi:hypothetical protein
VTTRDRYALTMGGAAIIVVVFGLRGLPWLWSHVSRVHQDLAARRELLVRAELDLRAVPGLQDSAKRLTAQVMDLAPRLLSGATASEAAAAFAGHISHLALTHNARLDRADPVPDSLKAGDLRRVTMDAVFESDVRGLAGLLGGFATALPVTRVTRLRVTANDPATPGSRAEVLRIELRVQAWYLGREAS